jgi:hypothetical protein
LFMFVLPKKPFFSRRASRAGFSWMFMFAVQIPPKIAARFARRSPHL